MTAPDTETEDNGPVWGATRSDCPSTRCRCGHTHTEHFAGELDMNPCGLCLCEFFQEAHAGFEPATTRG